MTAHSNKMTQEAEATLGKKRKISDVLSPFCYDEQETLTINIPKDFLGKYRANIEEVTRTANKFVLDLIWSKEDPNEKRKDFLKEMTEKQSLPYVAKNMFAMLDQKSLLQAREVSHKWKEFIDQETSLWTKLYTADNYTKAAEGFKAIKPSSSPMSNSQRKKKEKQRRSNELICSITRNMVQYSKHPNPTQSCIVTCNKKPEVFRGRSLTDMKYTCNTHDTNDIQYRQSDLSYSDCGNGATALHMAAYYGRQENVRMIMERLEDKSPIDRFGRTPLFYAIFGLENMYADKYSNQLGHLEVINYIIENTDQVNHRDNFDTTPLLACCLKDSLRKRDCQFNEATAMNILSMAENKNPADADGDTPLHTTYVQAKINIVKFIIENITEKNPPNLNGRTPLHVHADRVGSWFSPDDHCKVMLLMIQNVDDLHPKDVDGKTPADLLYERIKCISCGGHSWEIDDCETLFEIAQKNGYGEIWKILQCPDEMIS